MNRKVLDALATLQMGEKIYVPMDTIIQQIALGMSDSDDMAKVEKDVRRTLAGLTRIGLLERSGDSYTRTQLAETCSSLYFTVGNE